MSTKEVKNDTSPLPSETDEGWTVVQRRDKRIDLLKLNSFA